MLFLGSKFIMLEANYDPEILKYSHYPYPLKLRIAGENGHLANHIAGKTIAHLADTGLRSVMLGHLSKENNTPELAFTYISQKLKDKGIIEGEHLRIDVATTVPTRIFKLK